MWDLIKRSPCKGTKNLQLLKSSPTTGNSGSRYSGLCSVHSTVPRFLPRIFATQTNRRNEATMAEDKATHEEEQGKTTDSNWRYLAYAARIKTALTRSARYLGNDNQEINSHCSTTSVAYTSDMGEAFRPVVPAWIVKSAYGISWAYVLGDVAFEGYKERVRVMMLPLS